MIDDITLIYRRLGLPAYIYHFSGYYLLISFSNIHIDAFRAAVLLFHLINYLFTYYHGHKYFSWAYIAYSLHALNTAAKCITKTTACT